MKKLDKNTLKMIVKECLVEILAEGIITTESRYTSSKKNTLSEVLESKRSSTPKPKRSRSKKPSYLNSIRATDSDEKMIKNEDYERNIDRVTKSITKDPLMQSILADTAKTTLQEQISHESSSGANHSPPADGAASIVSKSDPEDLFGEASQNWANLAFS